MAKQKIEFNGFHFKVEEHERYLFALFTSSNLKALAYDLGTKTLYVLFKGKEEKRYGYLDVPSKVFYKLATADSVGSEFTKLVKKADYKYFDEDNK